MWWELDDTVTLVCTQRDGSVRLFSVANHPVFQVCGDFTLAFESWWPATTIYFALWADLELLRAVVTIYGSLLIRPVWSRIIFTRLIKLLKSFSSQHRYQCLAFRSSLPWTSRLLPMLRILSRFKPISSVPGWDFVHWTGLSPCPLIQPVAISIPR